LPQAKGFISIRLDDELKTELLQAADVERRSLSNFCRLLLEYGWGEYLKAGSMRNLLDREEHATHRSEEWPSKQQ
jgi:predicted transcriptional regulator